MSNTTEKLLRENIKKYRKAKGYTQVRLAVLVGVSEEYIGQLERGTCMPSVKRLISLAKALGVEVKDLFT